MRSGKLQELIWSFLIGWIIQNTSPSLSPLFLTMPSLTPINRLGGMLGENTEAVELPREREEEEERGS